MCVLDFVVPPAYNSQAGATDNIPTRDVSSEGGALPSVNGVEAGISPNADNATYCHGVQPITIEPMDCGDSNSNDVEPDVATSSTTIQRRNISHATLAEPSPSGEVMQPAMRVVYCGTVSGDQMLEQGSLGGLARNIISGSNPATATNVGPRSSESHSRNLQSSDSTAEYPVSVECIPPSEADSCRMRVSSVQRCSTDTSTPPGRTKQQRSSAIHTAAAAAAAASTSVTASPSATGSMVTGRKSKARRARSLDESTTLHHRYVILVHTW